MPRRKEVSQYNYNSRGLNSQNNFGAPNPAKGISSVGNPTYPGKVKCGVCLKWKQPHNYSNRQMKIINTNIRRFGPEAGVASLKVSCSSCMSGGNRLEWTCAQCHECKDIDAFSKVQRSLGDEAICQVCMHKVRSLDPSELVARDDDEDEDLSDFDEDSDEDGTSTITSSMASYSLTAGTGSNLASHWDDQGVCVEQFLRSGHSDVFTNSSTVSMTSSRAEALSREKNDDDDESTSEVGFDDSASHAAPSKARKSGYSQSNGAVKNSKWAKVKATSAYQDPNPPPPNLGSFAQIKAVGAAAALAHKNNSLYGGTDAGAKSGGWSQAPSKAQKTNKWGKAKSSAAYCPTAAPIGDDDDDDDDGGDDDDWKTQVYTYKSDDDDEDSD